MKKIIKYLSLIVLLFAFSTKVNGIEINQEEYERLKIERTYVIGSYIFDMSAHAPNLKDLMLAAQSAPKGDVSIIEIVISPNALTGEIMKTYRDILNNRVYSTFPDLDVEYIYKSEIKPSDEENETKIDLVEVFGYEVNFMDGEKIFSTTKVDEGSKVTAPSDTLKTGYIFDNWYTTDGFITPFDFSNTLIVNNTNIYGKWIANQYSIVFNDNVENETITVPESITKIYDIDYDISEQMVPQRLGYKFIGWSANSNITEITYTDSIDTDLTTGTTSQNLYAIWVKTPTLTNVSGGYSNGAMVTNFSINFEDYCTTENSELDCGIYSGYELYKVGENNSYSLIAYNEFNGNIPTSLGLNETANYVARVYIETTSGKLYSDYSTQVAGIPLTIATPTLTNVSGGYAIETIAMVTNFSINFEDYCTTENSELDCGIYSGYELYKVGENNSYIAIAYNEVNGNIPTELGLNETANYVARVYIETTEGRIYSDYSAPVAGIPLIVPTENLSITFDDNIAEETISITIAGEEVSETYPFGSILIVDNPVREGYTFIGWDTSDNVTTPQYKVSYGSDTITLPYVKSDETYYAYWQAVGTATWTVTFKIGDSQITAPSVVDNTLLDTATIAGYNDFIVNGTDVFSGWYTVVKYLSNNCTANGVHAPFGQNGIYFCSGNGDEIQAFDIETTTITSNTELYGYFNSAPEQPYTVTYDLNNGTNETLPDGEFYSNSQYPYYLPNSESFTAPIDISGVSAEFIGWSTVKDDCVHDNNEICINMDDSTTLPTDGLERNITLYALWSYTNVSIRYNKVSGCDLSLENCTITEADRDVLTVDNQYTFRTGDNINYSTEPNVTFNEYASSNDLIFSGWSLAPVYFDSNIDWFNLGDTTTQNDIYVSSFDLYPIFTYENMEAEFVLEGSPGLRSTLINNETSIDNILFTYGSTLTLPTELLSTPFIVGDELADSGFVWYGWSSTDVFNNTWGAANNIVEEANTSEIPNLNYKLVYVDYSDDSNESNIVTFSPVFVPNWYSDLIDPNSDVNTTSIDSYEELIGLYSIMDSLNESNKSITITINTPMSEMNGENIECYLDNITIGSNITLIMGSYIANEVSTPVIFSVSGNAEVYGTLVINKSAVYNSFGVYTGETGNVMIRYGATVNMTVDGTVVNYISNTPDSYIRMLDYCEGDTTCTNFSLLSLTYDGLFHGIRLMNDLDIEINKANLGIETDAFVIDNDEVYSVGYGSILYINITTVLDGSIEGAGTIELADIAYLYVGDYNNHNHMLGYISDEILIFDIDKNRIIYPIMNITFEDDTTDQVTNMPSDTTASLNSAYNIPNNVPVRNGYVFMGWIDELDNVYQPGTQVHIQNNYTFVAVWELATNVVSITYNSNGKTVTVFPENEMNIIKGSGRNTSYIEPVAIGYEFLSWNTMQDGTGTSYGLNADLGSVENNIILYAIWQEIEAPTWYNDVDTTFNLTATDYESLIGYLDVLNSLERNLIINVEDITFSSNATVGSNITLNTNSVTLTNNTALYVAGTLSVGVISETTNINIQGGEVIVQNGGTLIKDLPNDEPSITLIGTNGNISFDGVGEYEIGVFTNATGEYYDVRGAHVNINNAITIGTLDIAPNSVVNVLESIVLTSGLRSSEIPSEAATASLIISENKTITLTNTVTVYNTNIAVNDINRITNDSGL